MSLCRRGVERCETNVCVFLNELSRIIFLVVFKVKDHQKFKKILFLISHKNSLEDETIVVDSHLFLEFARIKEI